MRVGSTIAKLRRKKKQSLQEVADAVGVSKAHIWEIEKGIATNPSMDLVTRLANHFDVTIAYLVGEDVDAPDAPRDIQRMFRQASQLDDLERKILNDMLQSLIKNRPRS